MCSRSARVVAELPKRRKLLQPQQQHQPTPIWARACVFLNSIVDDGQRSEKVAPAIWKSNDVSLIGGALLVLMVHTFTQTNEHTHTQRKAIPADSGRQSRRQRCRRKSHDKSPLGIFEVYGYLQICFSHSPTTVTPHIMGRKKNRSTIDDSTTVAICVDASAKHAVLQVSENVFVTRALIT